MPSLPPEIIIQIFNEVATSEHAQQSLQALSLVSPDFLHLARAHRYRRRSITFLWGSLLTTPPQLDTAYYQELEIVRQPQLAPLVEQVNLRIRLLDVPEEAIDEAVRAFDEVSERCTNLSRLFITMSHWRPNTELYHFASAIARLPLVELSLPQIDGTSMNILTCLPELRRLTLDHPVAVAPDVAFDAVLPFALESLSLSTNIPCSLFQSLLSRSSASLRTLVLPSMTLIAVTSALQDFANLSNIHLTFDTIEEDHLSASSDSLLLIHHLDHLRLTWHSTRRSAWIEWAIPPSFFFRLPPTLLALDLSPAVFHYEGMALALRRGKLPRLRRLTMKGAATMGMAVMGALELLEVCKEAGVEVTLTGGDRLTPCDA